MPLPAFFRKLFANPQVVEKSMQRFEGFGTRFNNIGPHKEIVETALGAIKEMRGVLVDPSYEKLPGLLEAKNILECTIADMHVGRMVTKLTGRRNDAVRLTALSEILKREMDKPVSRSAAAKILKEYRTKEIHIPDEVVIISR